MVKNQTELNSIPMDVEDLWLHTFDTTGLTEFSLNRYPLLKSMVIGNNMFWEVTSLEISNITLLQSVDICSKSFFAASRLSLIGIIPKRIGIIGLSRLQSIRIDSAAFRDATIIEMTNLPSLQSIDIGDDSFPRVTTFTLNGLNDFKN